MITEKTTVEPALLYHATKAVQFVDVPELAFLMIDGYGDPNTSERFAGAIQALYGVSYTLKFQLKRGGGPYFKVAPLEGLWWTADVASFTAGEKVDGEWTLMIRQPDEITRELVEQAAREVAAKKLLPAALELRLDRFAEGRCAQVLHVGSYADEAPTIERLHAFIAEQGYELHGKHHEIYLGDPRRAKPEKLRTIIRQPVVPR